MGLSAERIPLDDGLLESSIQECLLELVHSGSIREPLVRLCGAFRAGLHAETCEIFLAGAGDAPPVTVAPLAALRRRSRS